MPINSRDELIDALCNNTTRFIVDKASIGNQTAGSPTSLWRATGTPGQGAIPSTATRCTNALTGAIGFNQQTPPATSYIAQLEGVPGNAVTVLEFHDRLMHMGGLSGTTITAQTVNLDVHGNIASDNLAERVGESDYSEVLWWLEWYTDTGSTAVNCTVNVTYNDGSSGNLTAASIVATRRAGTVTLLNSLIPAADSGKYIRDVNDLTLSASTLTAGSFGVTATRLIGSVFLPVASAKAKEDWASLGLNEIPNSACIAMIATTGSNNTGAIRASGKIVHG